RKAVTLDEASLSHHLTYKELSGHVDGILNGNEADRCWEHIEMCSECREDVEQLREFKAGAQVSRESSIKPTVQPGSRSALRPIPARPSWLARPFRLAALAASILIVAGGAVWLLTSGLRREIASLQAQVAEMRTENETLRKDTTELESLRNRLAEL